MRAPVELAAAEPASSEPPLLPPLVAVAEPGHGATASERHTPVGDPAGAAQHDGAARAAQRSGAKGDDLAAYMQRLATSLGLSHRAQNALIQEFANATLSRKLRMIGELEDELSEQHWVKSSKAKEARPRPPPQAPQAQRRSGTPPPQELQQNQPPKQDDKLDSGTLRSPWARLAHAAEHCDEFLGEAPRQSAEEAPAAVPGANLDALEELVDCETKSQEEVGADPSPASRSSCSVDGSGESDQEEDFGFDADRKTDRSAPLDDESVYRGRKFTPEELDEAWEALLSRALAHDKREPLRVQYYREQDFEARFHMFMEFSSYLRPLSEAGKRFREMIAREDPKSLHDPFGRGRVPNTGTDPTQLKPVGWVDWWLPSGTPGLVALCVAASVLLRLVIGNLADL